MSIIRQIEAFLEEDIGSGDLTAAIISGSTMAEAQIITREAMILCGKAWVEAVFNRLDSEIKITWLAAEGESVPENTILCVVNGRARAMLTGERTALNMLQTLSATATVAKKYADAVSGTRCKVLDTRKTLPGLRQAQKHAVQCGGCFNHRMGLYDGVLIKENHIIAAGCIENAVKQARKMTQVPVEVEVESLAEFKQALSAQPDRIMLDNFPLQDLQMAVALNSGLIELEASGNISLENIREVAETGVNYISIGALTKNVTAVDLSMRIELKEIS